MNSRLGILMLLLCAGIFSPDRADAQLNCRISSASVAFGTYSPASSTAHDATGSIDVSCRGRVGIVLATLSPGNSGTFSSRFMLSGSYPMAYNLYRNPSRTQVWGDGTGGSVISGFIKWRNGRQDVTLPVYGRVPAQQDVAAGSYLDTVMVTIYF